MRRAALLLPLLGLGAGAVAFAQDDPGGQGTEPTVRAREVFSLPGGCRPGERVTGSARRPWCRMPASGR